MALVVDTAQVCREDRFSAWRECAAELFEPIKVETRKSAYAVGGNRAAARLSGVRVDLIVIVSFLLAGFAAGIAGVIDASTTGSGNSNAFPDLALQAIAAVAIGGTSIFGGVGSVWRTVVGVLLLALITNGMDLLSISANFQPIVTGVVIVAAVAVSSLAERR